MMGRTKQPGFFAGEPRR